MEKVTGWGYGAGITEAKPTAKPDKTQEKTYPRLFQTGVGASCVLDL